MKEIMRVLFINRVDAFQKMGGDTIQMIKTKEGLESLNIKVDIALGNQEECIYNNYDIIHIFNIQTDKFCFDEIRKIQRIGKTVVVSPIWWDFEKNVIYDNSLIKRILGKKIVDLIKDFKLKIRYKRMEAILDYSTYILPNSELEIESLIRSFKFDSNKCKVVYNGISNDYICDIMNEHRLYALQVGRIEPVKNTLLTVRACKELKIPLKIVGKVSDENYYNQCISESDESIVEFIDQVDHNELIKLYNKAKVHILPSYRETPGLVSLEAGVLGCNIVSTEIGSAQEYFGDMVSYCNPKDYNSIKKAIETQWKKENNYELKNHIINNFTWDIAAKRTLDVYNKCLNAKEV